jgi:ferredoxin-NADP reductase
MIPPKQFSARLADKQALNEKFTQYFFELVEPNIFEFEAGQYASIVVDEHGTRRSYSICSSPDKNHGFELLIDATPNGVGVQFLSKLQFGDQIKFLAPLGMLTTTGAASDAPVTFVATASGIAPFRSIILDELQNKHRTTEITLYWGLRFVEDLFWQEQFEELATNFPNFHFHPVISKAIPEWPLCRGHVTDCLLVHGSPATAQYYLCGNAGMIADVQALLQQQNVAKESVHHEKFY